MNKFCREAYRVRSNGRQSFLVHLSCTCRRNLDFKSQSLPEGSPKWHSLPEREDSRNTNSNVSVNFGFRIRIFFHQQLFTKNVEIGHFLQSLPFLPDLSLYFLILRISQHFSPFTAVVCDPGVSVGKTYDCSLTMVGAERTGGIRFLCIGKVVHSLKTDKGLLFLLTKPFFCDQGSSDSAHDPRVRSPYYIFSQILLHSSEHCIVLECSSLYYNLISQTIQIRDTDHLCKYVFYDGPAQPGHNVPRQFSVALFRNNTAVHKNRTPAAQLGRIF